MKEKILAALRLQYVGMPAQMLGFFAEKLAAKITAEDQITVEITELEKGPIKPSDFATFNQQETDRRTSEAVRTHEANLKTKYNFVDKTQGAPPAPPKENEPAATDPKFAALMERLDKLEKEKATGEITNKLHAILKAKNIPLFVADGKTFEDEDALNAYVLKLETDWNAHNQEAVNTALKDQTKPPGSEDYKGNIGNDIADWAKKNTPEKV